MNSSDPTIDSAERARAARLRLLRMHHAAGVGHIGGNLSALDALLVLHHNVLRPEDRFILAKGHAAGALYVTLWSVGELRDEELEPAHSTKQSPVPKKGQRRRAAAERQGARVRVGLATAVRLAAQPVVVEKKSEAPITGLTALGTPEGFQSGGACGGGSTQGGVRTRW